MGCNGVQRSDLLFRARWEAKQLLFVEIVAGLRARAIRKQMKIQRLALCVSCLFREPKRSGGEIVHPEKVAKLQSSDHKLPTTTPLCFGLSAQKLYGDIRLQSTR